MTIFNTNALLRLREDLEFLKASQKLTADNIARVNSPGAQPLKLEQANFHTMLTLSQPQGVGLQAQNLALGRFNTVVDKENQTEAVPGESRISIENESIRMAELDTQHNMKTRLFSSWKKAVRMVINGGG